MITEREMLMLMSRSISAGGIGTSSTASRATKPTGTNRPRYAWARRIHPGTGLREIEAGLTVGVGIRSTALICYLLLCYLLICHLLRRLPAEPVHVRQH